MSNQSEQMNIHLNRIYDATEDLIKKLKFMLGRNYVKYIIQRLVEMELPMYFLSARSGLGRMYENRDYFDRLKIDDNQSQINKSFSYTAWFCHEDGYIRRVCDILIGLYFPEGLYKVGDTVVISIGNLTLCTLVLNDLNKIYKPFFDIDWLYLISLQYVKVTVDTNDRSFYAVGIYIDDNQRKEVARFGHKLMAPNGKLLEISGGYAYFAGDGIEYYNSSPYVYSANLIKKHIKRYISKKNSSEPFVVYI